MTGKIAVVRKDKAVLPTFVTNKIKNNQTK